MKTFILLSAVPGAGKSTWAEQYRLTHKNVFVVSSDEIRKELGGSYQYFEQEADVWRIFFERIEEYRDKNVDVTVIGDSTNLENKFRILYAKNLKGFDRKELVILKRPLEFVLKHNKDRNAAKFVPEEVIVRMFNTFEEPTKEVYDLYNEVQVIDGWFDSTKVDDSFHYKD